MTEAFIALEVTSYRVRRSGSPLRYGCTAAKEGATPARVSTVATIARIARRYPRALHEARRYPWTALGDACVPT